MIPCDPALPGLAAVRRRRLAGAVLGPLLGYTPGARATFEGRLGRHRVAVRLYAKDPAGEAALYAAAAQAGLAGDAGPRVPPLLAWQRELRVLVLGWLEGPTARDLIGSGQGERAGELAAQWLHCTSTLRIELGPSIGASRLQARMEGWIGALAANDAVLGRRAVALAEILTRACPPRGRPGLVHGALYEHHIVDLDEAPGAIDWQRHGRGELELDAAAFLAGLTRTGLRSPPLAGEAAAAEAAFLRVSNGLLHEQGLAWHRAAALFQMARARLQGGASEESARLLDAALRHARRL